MKADIFQSGGHCWIFQICRHIECSTSTASSFRIWNRSVGIPLPLLALFIVVLPKAHLTSHPRISSFRSVTSPLWLSRSLRSFLYQFSLVPLSVWLFVTTWTAACQASLSITNSQSLLKLMSIESMMTFNHLILCHSLLLPSIFPSIRVFSNKSALHIRWPSYWSFSFSISASNEYLGLNSFRIDWFDLLAVQRTFKSLLHNHSLKASILWHSALLSNFHIHTWKLEKP